MNTPPPPFLAELATHRPEFVALAAEIRERAYYTPGALDAKTKLLIALALDIAAGAEEGVKTLAARARAAGATQDEILDVLQVCYSVGGLQRLSSGAKAL